MHPVVAEGLAAELDRLAAVIKHEWAWPSPAAGFTVWLFGRHGMPGVFTPPSPTLPVEPDGRLGEAPVLAAYGYLLAATAGPERTVIDVWAAGVDRLAGRDPLPGDRMSFFFRPIELLGLAQGAVAIAEHHPRPRQWLRTVLRDGMPRLGPDTWSVALATYASAVLGDLTAAGRIEPVIDAAVDLALLWLLVTEAPDAAALIGLSQTVDEVESQLLHRISLTSTGSIDVAEAAVLHCSVTSAVRTNLAHSGTGRQAALTTITALLRRFPAIVRELNTRHAGRPGLAEINDEYDVQDLLRGVLRGLFDDVRDEEYTPSHAGVSSRMDLLLKREHIVIETKMTRPSLDQRRITEELAIDKELYRSHPDCQTLVCFVYDPQHRLSNPTALEDDLTDLHGPLPTIVVVGPWS